MLTAIIIAIVLIALLGVYALLTTAADTMIEATTNEGGER